MKLDPIVFSLLDTDLYKFNMDQVIFHKHTDLSGEYYFRCRNEGVTFTREMFDEINAQIDHLCMLKFAKEELDYLRSIRFIKNDYVEFLRLWRPIRDYVETRLSGDGQLCIVVKGPLFSAMQFEIYLLEIVNEVYFRMKYDYDALLISAKERLDQKIQDFQTGKYTFTFAEFGCRRRLSREWEDVVVRRLSAETQNLIGTSNVYLAMKYNCVPLGTMSHQLISFEENVSGVFECNFNVMKKFSDVYDGDNGIYLYDCFGDEVFFSNLSKRMAMMYKGLRVDSGDEFEQTEKIIAKYKSLGIDPATKQVCYSNGLDIDKAIEIHKYVNGRVQDSYGVGTFLTCDVTGAEPMNIVVKLTRGRITELREWHDCVKLSCDKGKTLGNPDKCAYLQSVIGE